MQDALTIYFDGEKHAGLFLAGVGAASVVAAAVMFFRGLTDLRSFAVTLGVVAMAQIALGIGLYLRTGPQVSRLTAQLGSEPLRFHADEAARMKRVQRNFVVIEYVEVVLIIVSAVAAVAGRNRPGLTGVALGLLIGAACVLAFDIVAERRGAVYLSALDGGNAP